MVVGKTPLGRLVPRDFAGWSLEAEQTQCFDQNSGCAQIDQMKIPQLVACSVMEILMGVGFEVATAIELIDRQPPWVVQMR